MTPEEIRALAIDQLVHKLWWVLDDPDDFKTELIIYTAAVEAKERERCAKLCESRVPPDARHGTTDVEDEYRACAEAIRSLK